MRGRLSARERWTLEVKGSLPPPVGKGPPRLTRAGSAGAGDPPVAVRRQRVRADRALVPGVVVEVGQATGADRAHGRPRHGRRLGPGRARAAGRPPPWRRACCWWTCGSLLVVPRGRARGLRGGRRPAGVDTDNHSNGLIRVTPVAHKGSTGGGVHPTVPGTANGRARWAERADEPACKPDSVPGRLAAVPFGGHPSRPAVADRLLRPTRRHRTGRPRTPAQVPWGTLLALLRVGFT
ncbi:hypothetical protein B0I31_107517 [Saccharothrix carnea]|uniref:Uncharacterized protein n=1 Tax=Saccharothrix carnea TaxID=1280637 RepID=A0A2P8I7P1_SACCR|nr:hypothetical protein B0I31_107517 [Saccharothrix carnea]